MALRPIRIVVAWGMHVSVAELCMQQAHNQIPGRSELATIRTLTKVVRAFTDSLTVDWIGSTLENHRSRLLVQLADNFYQHTWGDMLDFHAIILAYYNTATPPVRSCVYTIHHCPKRAFFHFCWRHWVKTLSVNSIVRSEQSLFSRHYKKYGLSNLNKVLRHTKLLYLCTSRLVSFGRLNQVS